MCEEVNNHHCILRHGANSRLGIISVAVRLGRDTCASDGIVLLIRVICSEVFRLMP